MLTTNNYQLTTVLLPLLTTTNYQLTTIMSYWLIKSEPSVYPWDQLVKDKKTFWDGVRNYAARIHFGR